MPESKTRILVVDDDPDLRSMLMDTLDAIGYEAASASDGVEALDELGKHDSHHWYDLVITDIKMPNMDGITLLKKVRRYYPGLPVLFITGVASPEMVAQAPPDGFLAKPFRISNLEKLIEDALAARFSNIRPDHQPRVLINVPETDFRELLNEALVHSRYLPFAVAGGDAALQELERGQFDVMITGIEKRAVDSRRSIELIRKKHPSLPTVLVSGSYTLDEVQRLSDPIQFDGFVHRPFKVGQLLESLDRAIKPFSQQKA